MDMWRPVQDSALQHHEHKILLSYDSRRTLRVSQTITPTALDSTRRPLGPHAFPSYLILSQYMAVDLADPAHRPHFPPVRTSSTGTVVFLPSQTCGPTPVDASLMHVFARPSSLTMSLRGASCECPCGTFLPDQPISRQSLL